MSINVTLCFEKIEEIEDLEGALKLALDIGYDKPVVLDAINIFGMAKRVLHEQENSTEPEETTG